MKQALLRTGDTLKITETDILVRLGEQAEILLKVEEVNGAVHASHNGGTGLILAWDGERPGINHPELTGLGLFSYEISTRVKMSELHTRLGALLAQAGEYLHASAWRLARADATGLLFLDDARLKVVRIEITQSGALASYLPGETQRRVLAVSSMKAAQTVNVADHGGRRVIWKPWKHQS